MKTHLNRILLLANLLAIITSVGCGTILPGSGTASDALKVLSAQADAWNRGDLEGFMKGYWESEQLRFASGDAVQRGWLMTLQRYKSRYPDKKTMGTLAFDELETTAVASDTVIVFGRWSLTRETDKPHGLFTLTFQKKSGQWRIIQDHTSAASPPQ